MAWWNAEVISPAWPRHTGKVVAEAFPGKEVTELRQTLGF